MFFSFYMYTAQLDEDHLCINQNLKSIDSNSCNDSKVVSKLSSSTTPGD